MNKTIHNIFGIVLLALIALGQLERITAFGVSFYAFEAVIGAWLIFLVGVGRTRRGILQLLFQTPRRVLLPLLTITSLVLLSWGISYFQHTFNFLSILYTIRYASYISLALILYQLNIFSKKHLTLATTLFFTSFLLQGFLQYFLIKDTRFLAEYGWDDHYSRFMGAVFDPNFMGMIVIIGFTWFWNQWQSLSKKQNIYSYPILLTLSLVGITLTWSRSTYLAFIMLAITSIALSIWRTKLFSFTKLHHPKNSLLPWALALILFVTIVPKPPGEGGNLARTASINNRINSTQARTESLNSTQLLIGKGLFAIKKPQAANIPNYSKLPDNITIFFLEGFGLIGIGVLLWLLFETTRKTNWRHHSSLFPIGAALLTHSLFNNSLFQPLVLLGFLLLILGKKANT